MSKEEIAADERIESEPDERHAPSTPWDRVPFDDGQQCPFGRVWCDPASTAAPEQCLSCWLRHYREDDPHPEVAAVADPDPDETEDKDL